MVSRGRGPWRRDWYSVCSAHRSGGPDDPCDRCRAGTWRNAWAAAVGRITFRLWPGLWRAWANRRPLPCRLGLHRGREVHTDRHGVSHGYSPCGRCGR